MSYGSPSWIVCSSRRERPRARLVCFPHGGGAAHAFRAWPDVLPDWLEVLAINPPGRGARLREPAIDDMASVADAVIAELRPHLDLPLLLFGHSVGALVAFEVARRLEADGVSPLLVIVSGHAEPSAASQAATLSTSSDEALLSEIEALGLLPSGAVASDELRDLVLPPLRADFRLAEQYRIAPDARLDCGITAIGGSDDGLAPPSALDAWRIRTRGPFAGRVFPGGHFFTETARGELLSFLATTAEAQLAGLPPSVMIGAAEDYPLDACLHELFRDRARLCPDRLALVGPDRQLSFAEIDRDSDVLARVLIARGCGVDRMVAIVMETSADYVAAVLAILKAGGAYLPIPLVTPDRAIGDILDSVAPVAIVTREALAKRLPVSWRREERLIVLGEDWVARLSEAGLPEPGAAAGKPGPLSLAYCVMTSGTTGKPKGIVCPHRGAVNSYWWRFRHLPYGADEREACNVFFVWEVLRPLLEGRPAYVIPDDVIFDPRRLVDFLERHRITRVLFTPSLAEQVLNAFGDGLAERLVALRMVILNGEVVSRKLAERLHAALPHVALVNDYSISECHDVATSRVGEARPHAACRTLPAGRVMGNVRVYILDDDMKPVPWGVPGEVYVAGPTLARAYLGLPEETAERFLPDPFQGGEARMFRTGDIGRALPDGQLEIRGRAKFMVKLRGYTVVPSAVEAAIAAHPAVGAVAVVPIDDPATGQPACLAAYIAGRDGLLSESDLAGVRAFLKEGLPVHAIPAHLVAMAALPIQASTGKVDRKRLPAPAPVAGGPVVALREEAASEDAGSIAAPMREVWCAVLGRAPAGHQDNFFDIGGHSLLAIRLALSAEARFGAKLDVVDVFNHPTFGAFCRHVAGRRMAEGSTGIEPAGARDGARASSRKGPAEIAVIGMACRFPGADDPGALWEKLVGGIECLRRFSADELRARGVRADLAGDPSYIRTGAVIEGVDQFDARYFGLSEREATLMDPQQRLFFECCAEALTGAGYPARPGGLEVRRSVTGVWAGCYLPTYLVHHLGAARHLDPADPTTFHLAETGNAADYLPTRAAYLLDLTGPAIAVQTSCSTGLVAITEAAAALAASRCDMALAGASSITFPQGGYLHVEGHIGSRSGQCRTFDAAADGTILGDGVGVVVLRRLEDALADGDDVLAVIKGYGVNNDGAGKAGYSAPSGRGQEQAIRAAMEMAGVGGADIGYVEAHGTATIIGDPIEVRALDEAFGRGGGGPGTCALGSIKANIGHSNIAAGVAGFIKAVLMLRHRRIPPQINFTHANPELRLHQTPFRIETVGRAWDVGSGGRRLAGVSSFGIGGTNAHVVLEEAPAEAGGRVPARSVAPPAYERRRHWPRDDVAQAAHAHEMAKAPDVWSPEARQPDVRLAWQDRFYVPSLRRISPPVAHMVDAPRQCWLVLGPPPNDADTVTSEAAKALEARGHEVALCRSLDAPAMGAAIDRLVTSGGAARILTTWHLAGGGGRPSVEAILSPVLLLARLLFDRPARHPVAVTVVTPDVPPVEVVRGPLLSLQQEDPTIEARVVEVRVRNASSTGTAPLASGFPDWVTHLIDECAAPVLRPERFVAIRNGTRWTERFDRLTLGDAQRQAGRERLRNGPHIITGGAGRIGAVLAAHLGRLGADVVLVSRRPAIGANAGGPITHVAADVTDRAAIGRIVAGTRDRHGRIGGIFHAAGLARLQDLADVSPASVAAELAPKVAGTSAILEALAEAGHGSTPPGFVMLFSSLAATLGGLGLGAYAAANRYLDMVAAEADGRHPFPVLSIGFDDWDFDYGDGQQASYAHSRRGLAIPPDEGIAAIEAILGEPGLARVLVSATPLEPRLERWVDRAGRGSSGAALDQSPTGGEVAAGARREADHTKSRSSGAPVGGAGAADLVSEDEARVRAAYEAVLGGGGIGLDDDFFDLGGDSLLATEIVLAINRGGGAEGLRITDVMEHASIRKLARIVGRDGTATDRGDESHHQADNA